MRLAQPAPQGAGTAGWHAPPPSDRAAPATTPDIRRLGAADAPALEAHLLRLAGHDRRMRFCGDLGDAAVRRHCALIDWPRTEILGAHVGGELRAVVELFVHPFPHSHEADLALSVERAFQGLGLGSALLRKALMLARNRCVGSVHMACMVGNRRMQRLAAKFGATLSLGDGDVEGRIRAPWPTYLTLVEEAALESRSRLRAVFRPGPPPAAAAD